MRYAIVLKDKQNNYFYLSYRNNNYTFGLSPSEAILLSSEQLPNWLEKRTEEIKNKYGFINHKVIPLKFF